MKTGFKSYMEMQGTKNHQNDLGKEQSWRIHTSQFQKLSTKLQKSKLCAN